MLGPRPPRGGAAAARYGQLEPCADVAPRAPPNLKCTGGAFRELRLGTGLLEDSRVRERTSRSAFRPGRSPVARTRTRTRTRTRFDFQENEDVLNGSFEKSRVAGAFPGEEFPGSPPRKQARTAPRAGFWTAEAYKKPTKGPRSWTTNFSPLGQEAADRRHFNDQNLSWRRIRGEKIGEVEIRRATFAPHMKT